MGKSFISLSAFLIMLPIIYLPTYTYKSNNKLKSYILSLSENSRFPGKWKRALIINQTFPSKDLLRRQWLCHPTHAKDDKPPPIQRQIQEGQDLPMARC